MGGDLLSKGCKTWTDIDRFDHLEKRKWADFAAGCPRRRGNVCFQWDKEICEMSRCLPWYTLTWRERGGV